MAPQQLDTQQRTSYGHWRILRVLGEGGMGRVYLAEHETIGRRVALKVLKGPLARCPDLVERFFAEAHAVNRIRHPGIVEVTDCFIDADDDTPCIVMELLEGRTLAQELARGPLAPARVARIGVEVAEALAAAHAAGVIHRDLKPDNLFLLAGSGRVKVLDFGVAKLQQPMPGSHVQTLAGSIMGTPDYMAPEQLGGKVVDGRADIYSLGASLYHAVTGRLPFPADSFGELVVAHLTKPPPKPSQFARIPQALEQVLLALLEKPMDRRPQTMNDVAMLLRSAERLGARPPRTMPPSTTLAQARAQLALASPATRAAVDAARAHMPASAERALSGAARPLSFDGVLRALPAPAVAAAQSAAAAAPSTAAPSTAAFVDERAASVDSRIDLAELASFAHEPTPPATLPLGSGAPPLLPLVHGELVDADADADAGAARAREDDVIERMRLDDAGAQAWRCPSNALAFARIAGSHEAGVAGIAPSPPAPPWAWGAVAGLLALALVAGTSWTTDAKAAAAASAEDVSFARPDGAAPAVGVVDDAACSFADVDAALVPAAPAAAAVERAPATTKRPAGAAAAPAAVKLRRVYSKAQSDATTTSTAPNARRAVLDPFAGKRR